MKRKSGPLPTGETVITDILALSKAELTKVIDAITKAPKFTPTVRIERRAGSMPILAIGAIPHDGPRNNLTTVAEVLQLRWNLNPNSVGRRALDTFRDISQPVFTAHENRKRKSNPALAAEVARYKAQVFTDLQIADKLHITLDAVKARRPRSTS